MISQLSDGPKGIEAHFADSEVRQYVSNILVVVQQRMLVHNRHPFDPACQRLHEQPTYTNRVHAHVDFL